MEEQMSPVEDVWENECQNTFQTDAETEEQNHVTVPVALDAVVFTLLHIEGKLIEPGEEPLCSRCRCRRIIPDPPNPAEQDQYVAFIKHLKRVVASMESEQPSSQPTSCV